MKGYQFPLTMTGMNYLSIQEAICVLLEDLKEAVYSLLFHHKCITVLPWKISSQADNPSKLMFRILMSTPNE